MRNYFFTFFFIFLSLLSPPLGFSQDNPTSSEKSIMLSGRIVESKGGKPIEYANVIIFDQSHSTQLNGVSTNNQGYFLIKGLKPRIYIVEVSFMGFETIADTVELFDSQSSVDVGTIRLKQSVIWVKGVETVADEPTLEFKVDKKVINVSRQFTTVSGSAVDILENVPTVTVDIEGNVSLRGSTNFTVLIDNKPTVLESSDALKQIPASTIENIEIITNPSAKYDPAGVAGIINVITKKSISGITSGIGTFNIGLDDKYGGDVTLRHSAKRLEFILGADYNKMNFPGNSSTENEIDMGDTVSFIHSSGNSSWGRAFYGLKGGVGIKFTNRDVLNIGGDLRGMDMTHSGHEDYDTWTSPPDLHEYYTSESEMTHGFNTYAINTNFQHLFKEKDREHKLTIYGVGSRSSGDEQSTTALYDLNNIQTDGKRSIGEGPSMRARLNIDYSQPIWVVNKIETGFQYRYNQSEDDVRTYFYDTSTGIYEYMPQFSHTTDYTDNIYALYTTYSGKLDKLGYQGGLRSEYNYRLMELLGEGGNDRFTIDKWDFFPTLHASYSITGQHQLMASYTRRIDRPRGHELEPFETWVDAYNVRKGNPDLKPEYINSYEFGYMRRFGSSVSGGGGGGNSFSIESYYRKTFNKIEHVRSIYDQNQNGGVILETFDNVGVAYSYGAELMINTDLFKFKWLDINLTGNLYNYQIEGVVPATGETFSQESFNWSARLNNTIKLGKETKFQITGIYNSASVTSQGSREPFIIANTALKRDFFNRKFTATLQVRDVLGTGNFEYTTESENLHLHSEMSRKSPVIMLALSYNFNNYKQDRPTRDEEQQLGDEGEEGMQQDRTP